ncbi:MAG: hypothetical protein ACK5UE_08780 [Chitinophagales bacterium]|jgi:hypothetical protein
MKLLKTTVFLVISNIAISQDIPQNKYDIIHYKDYTEELLSNGDDNKIHRIGLQYDRTTFFNPTFGTSIQNGTLSNTIGGSINYKLQITRQFVVDADVFFHYLPATDYTYYQIGGEASAGIILIPFTLKLTRILQPYATLGYQYSHIALLSATSQVIYDAEKGKTVSTSAPIWKAGLLINLGKSVYFNAQYKQSFIADEGKAFGSWGAGIGLRF